MVSQVEPFERTAMDRYRENLSIHALRACIGAPTDGATGA
jgi:hypothetical protein